MNPLLHFWGHGASRGCNPNRLFDGDWYLRYNPDVGAAGLNPLQHYLQYGAAEGRNPCAQFDSAWYLRTSPDQIPGKLTPLGDYLRYGHLEGRSCQRPVDQARHPQKGKGDARGHARVASIQPLSVTMTA